MSEAALISDCRSSPQLADQSPVPTPVLSPSECFDLLSRGKVLKYNICGLVAPGQRREHVPTSLINTHLPPAAQYACLHWVGHFRDVGITDDSPLHQFLKRSFLHWLEALSLMKRFPDANEIISKLKECVDCAAGTNVKAFLDDAECFIRAFGPAIASVPLQVYWCGLFFSPAESLIRKTFAQNGARLDDNMPLTHSGWRQHNFFLHGHCGPVYTISLSSDGELLASGSSDKTVKIWNLSLRKPLRTLRGHTGPVNTVAFSSHGRLLASGSSADIKIWDTASGTCLRTLDGHDGSIRLVSFAPGDEQLVSYSFDRTVKTWCLRTGLCATSLRTAEAACSAVFSPSCQKLALGLFDKGGIRVWDLRTKRCQSTINNYHQSGHGDTVRSIAFSSNGEKLASYSFDGTIKVWNLKDSTHLRTLRVSDSIFSITFSHDSRQLVLGSSSDGSTAKICDSETGQVSRTFRGHGGPVSSAMLSADETRLVSASLDGIIRVWCTEGNCQDEYHDGHESEVLSLVSSPDGQRLASTSKHGTSTKIWMPNSGKCIQTLQGHKSSILATAFTPDGRQLASASIDGEIKIWDLCYSHCLQTLQEHAGLIQSIALSTKRSILVSAFDTGMVSVWNLSRGACVRRYKGHGSAVKVLTLCPQSKSLATGSCDKTIKIWSLGCARDPLTLEGHTDEVRSLSYSAKSTRLASASLDETIRVWDPATGTCLHTIQALAYPNILSFETLSDSVICTSYGLLDLECTLLDTQPSMAFQQDVSLRGWGISPNGEWIMKDGEPLIWIPMDYQSSQVAITGSSLALGGNRGHVLTIPLQSVLRLTERLSHCEME